MTQNTTYNGWNNRTTWNIMLWLDNDEPMYREYISRVKALKDQKIRLSGIRARAIVTDIMGTTTPDGCKVTSKCVDWKAIAESMLEGVE